MDEFRQALIEYYKPYEGQFNYQNMLTGQLDLTRFYIIADEISVYHPILDSSVLSSGCGTAGDLLAFMEKGAASAFGIEVDGKLAELARLRFLGKPFQDRVSFQIYNGGRLPFSSNSFDIVFSMHVIEHTQDPRLYLEELFRVIKPGGILFFDYPNRYYGIEQHTHLKYIHYLPRHLRSRLIRLLMCPSLKDRFDRETQYKLATYFDVHYPSPGYILRVMRQNQKRFHLSLEDGFFFSYSPERVSYRAYQGGYLFGPARRHTAFRMIVRKGRIS